MLQGLPRSELCEIAAHRAFVNCTLVIPPLVFRQAFPGGQLREAFFKTPDLIITFCRTGLKKSRALLKNQKFLYFIYKYSNFVIVKK